MELAFAPAPVKVNPAPVPERVMAVVAAAVFVRVLDMPRVVTPDIAPAVVTSNAAESTEKLPAPEKAKVPEVCAYPVDPDMAPAFILRELILPVTFAATTPVLDIP